MRKESRNNTQQNNHKKTTSKKASYVSYSIPDVSHQLSFINEALTLTDQILPDPIISGKNEM